MSSTSSMDIALSTVTSPMSAVFTPPSSCSSHWTYEPPSENSVSGGLLIQAAQFRFPDTPCYPTGFGGWGRAPSFFQVFSPGACPTGYTEANNQYNKEVTSAVCCPRYPSSSSEPSYKTLLTMPQRFRLYEFAKQRKRRRQDGDILWMHELLHRRGCHDGFCSGRWLLLDSRRHNDRLHHRLGPNHHVGAAHHGRLSKHRPWSVYNNHS